MTDPKVLQPSTDHEAIQYIAHKVDELSEDVQEIKKSTPEMASKDYVDKAVGGLNERLTDHISGKIDKDGDTSFLWRFFNSSIGQRVASFLMLLLLLGAFSLMNTASTQTVVQEIQHLAGVDTSQVQNQQNERQNNG